MAIFPRLLLLLTVLLCHRAIPSAEAKKVVVGDVADVADNEEDDQWRSWAGRSRYDDPTRKVPSYGMIKLRFKENRKIEEVGELIDRWKDKLKTGMASVNFKPIDPNTLFINLREDDEFEDLKAFLLEQPEVYEFMVNGQAHRRPEDPALEQADLGGMDPEYRRRREERKQRMREERRREREERQGEKREKREKRARQRERELERISKIRMERRQREIEGREEL